MTSTKNIRGFAAQSLTVSNFTLPMIPDGGSGVSALRWFDVQIDVEPVHVAHDSAHRELAMWIYLYDVTRIDGEARVCSVVTVGRRREVTHHQYRSAGKKDASQ